MTSLLTTLQHLQSIATPRFKQWLGNMLVSNPNGLGHDLIEGNTDSLNTQPADFDNMLRYAEMLEWIERTAFQPSISQCAFYGLQYGNICNTDQFVKDHHASWFMWRILDKTSIELFLGSEMPERPTFELGERVKYNAGALVQMGKDGAKRRGTIVGFCSGSMGHFPRIKWDDWEEIHGISPAAICTVVNVTHTKNQRLADSYERVGGRYIGKAAAIRSRSK